MMLIAWGSVVRVMSRKKKRRMPRNLGPCTVALVCSSQTGPCSFLVDFFCPGSTKMDSLGLVWNSGNYQVHLCSFSHSPLSVLQSMPTLPSSSLVLRIHSCVLSINANSPIILGFDISVLLLRLIFNLSTCQCFATRTGYREGLLYEDVLSVFLFSPHPFSPIY